MTHSHSVIRRSRRLLAPLAVIVLAAGCVQTSAQPAPPPPPQVTVASVIERDVTEWDEFRALDLDRLASVLRGKVLVDLRNVYDRRDAEEAGLTYYGIGRGNEGVGG